MERQSYVVGSRVSHSLDAKSPTCLFRARKTGPCTPRDEKSTNGLERGGARIALLRSLQKLEHIVASIGTSQA